MFRALLCPLSGAQEYYTDGCCLWYLVLWFSSCWSGVELRVMCPVCGIMPIIRSSRVLYRWFLLVVLGALVFKFLVWCGAEGYVSGLRDYAHHQELKSIIQMVAACGTWCFGFQVVGLVWSWGLCVRFAGLCPSSGALEYIQMVAACGTFFAIKPHLLHLVGLLFLRSNYFPL